MRFKLFIPFLFVLVLAAAITQNQATQKVRRQKEVQSYLARVPTGRIEMDHETPESFVIHVYNIEKDHTATFNWFDVDKKTGKIKKEFP